jgi:DNA-binding IclR family transcriptional regulator
MVESETLVVFRILGVLAKARDLGHALPVQEIASAAHLGRPQAERYISLLEHAGAIRAEVIPSQHAEYNLTKYGLQRLSGGCAR